ncbi:hypothetical protein RRG08_017373, partial [Elysia crispata]
KDWSENVLSRGWTLPQVHSSSNLNMMSVPIKAPTWPLLDFLIDLWGRARVMKSSNSAMVRMPLSPVGIAIDRQEGGLGFDS